MDARAEIVANFGVERWTVFPGAEVCAGCLFLNGRLFFVGEGPYPGLHPNCRCGRLPVETAGISGAGLIRLVLEARANGRQEWFLEEEARRRAEEDRERRGVGALAERDAGFVRVREAELRRERRRGGR